MGSGFRFRADPSTYSTLMSLETLDDGRRARSRATRERILLTAERLFAESGIGNVSLRDIGIAANQKNIGAVQYHFGDRDNLIVQIVIYRAQVPLAPGRRARRYSVSHDRRQFRRCDAKGHG